MAYPPVVPPVTRTNATPQVNNHPSDHNGISAALTDIINELGPNPSDTFPSVDDRIDDLATRVGRIPVQYSAIGGGGGVSGGFADFAQLLFPAQPVPGTIMIWSYTRMDFNGGSGYTVKIYAGSTVLAQRGLEANEMAPGRQIYVTMVSSVRNVVGSAAQLIVRGEGAANVVWYADGTVNRIDALFAPDRPT